MTSSRSAAVSRTDDTPTEKHIRPTVRRNNATKSGSDNNYNNKIKNVDDILEKTRLRMTRMRLNDGDKTASFPNDKKSFSSPKQQQDPVVHHHVSFMENSEKPQSLAKNLQPKKGILYKEARYHPQRKTSIDDGKECLKRFETDSLAQELGLENNMEECNGTPNTPFMKEFVMESDISSMNMTSKKGGNDALQVEGYTPRTTSAFSKKNKTRQADPDQKGRKSGRINSSPPKKTDEFLEREPIMSFDTNEEGQADLSATPSHPKRTVSEKGERMIEAHMQFACMTKEEYQDSMELAKSLGLTTLEDKQTLEQKNDKNNISQGNEPRMNDCHHQGEDDALEDLDALKDLDALEEERIFLGQHDVFSLEDSSSDDDDDDEPLGDFLEATDDSWKEEPARELRSFMILWNAIAAWITPEAVAILREWDAERTGDITSLCLTTTTVISTKKREEETAKCDISASRCAGHMAMLKMNVACSLIELGYDPLDGYTRRMSEARLARFVSCFDYSEAMVKLHSRLWRALTIVLLTIVLPAPRGVLTHTKNEDFIITTGEEDTFTNHNCSGVVVLPMSLQAVDMTMQEYQYLSKSAIRSLNMGIVSNEH